MDFPTGVIERLLTAYWPVFVQMGEEGTVPYIWRAANPDAPLPEFAATSGMPNKRPSHLPRQDNYCDCGLFALTYMHYFSFMPPETLDINKLQTLGGRMSLPRASTFKSKYCTLYCTSVQLAVETLTQNSMMPWWRLSDEPAYVKLQDTITCWKK